MTFNPDIKVTILLASNKSTWYKIELYLQWPSIGSRLSCTWSIKQCHFQWPWTTLNPDFEVTPLFDAGYLRNGTKHMV